MNKETFRTLVAVLRVFVDAVNRGNDGTFHANEITQQVCRALQRRKDKEKKNTHGYVITALRAMKAKQILFEAIDEWGDDPLRRPKAVENRRTFGLTKTALDYLTSDNNLRGYSVQSEIVLTSMLAEFGVIQSAQREFSYVPPALEKTVRAIEQKEPITATTQTDSMEVTLTATNEDNNIQRLVATVRNRSADWGSVGTPADLLGGLLALERAGEINDNIPASAAKLLWPDSRRQNYKDVCNFLKQHNIIAAFEERKRPGDAAGARPYGLKLTPLGRAVALAGNFVDTRPASERTHTRAGNAKNKPLMLKRNEKHMTTNNAETASSGHPRAPISGADYDQLLTSFQTRIDTLERLLATAQQNGGALPPAPAPVNTPENVMYTEPVTMRVILTRAVPAIVATFQDLIGKEASIGAASEKGVTTSINADGLYLALTEITNAINGIKAYVSECMKHDEEVDLSLIEKYAEAYATAADNLTKKHTLPIMGDTLHIKRFLTGKNKIRRELWRRPAKQEA
jgi:hypothetical protein